MSKHEVKVVKLGAPRKHHNADSLEIFKVWDYEVVTRIGEWKEGDLATFVEPDYVVPNTEQFSFLGDSDRSRRIKSKKLRGVWSYGLLTAAPPGSNEGDNVIEQLGIVRYEPPVDIQLETDDCEAPRGIYPKYDLENFQKYSHLLIEGEEVIVTEKIHGANARYTFIDTNIYCGSRTRWKKQNTNNLWWRALDSCPLLRSYIIDNPESCVYGEVFGQVQDLKYNSKQGQVFFAAFDIWEKNRWLTPEEFWGNFGKEKTFSIYRLTLPLVPLLYRGPYSKDKMLELAQGKSVLADHVKEGIVIEPIKSREDPEIGRVKLKLINPEYLSR